MELLNRYLNAVKFWLPRAQQEDILRELTENIRSQMEDQEAALGRPLEEAEQAAILKQHGHPMVVASRYWQRQYLIGPTLFPIYWFVVRLAVVLSVASFFLAQITTATTGKPAGDLVRGLLEFPGIAITTFAWVTIVFAIIDWANSKYRPGSSWDPRSLPKVSATVRKHARKNPLMELAAWLVAIAWWAAIPSAPVLLFGGAASFLQLTPAWQDMHLPVLFVLIAPLAIDAARGIRPDWEWLGLAARMGRTLATLVMLSILLKAGTLVTVTGSLASNQQVVDALQLSITLLLAIGSIICVLQLLFQVVGLIRAAGRGAFPVALL